MTRRIAVSLFAIVLASAAAAAPPDPKRALAGIDRLIEEALAAQKIPGASVAVVVGDEVVLLKGYGWRDVEQKLPMTPDTIVPIASVTKQFTVASLGTLVRQGKLDWDEPVRDYLPEFRLHDDYATLRATTRDLVTHRIGMPRHDFAWFGSSDSREQLFGRLRWLPFSEGIRTTFQYNNFMFMTAGLLAGRLAGKSYEEHVEDSLLEPLGMTRTTFSLATLASDRDHATGYQLDNERRPVRTEFVSAEAMAPTGALNSTARDLGRWMRMMLNGGALDGKRILMAADVQAMMQPNMPVGPATFPEFGFRSYGMGFSVQNYRGHEVASHGGNMPGAAAVVVMVPKEKIGVAVLTNRSAGRLRDGLPYEIIDRLTGLPSADLVNRHAALEAKAFEAEDAAKEAGVTTRKSGTRPSHDIAEYASRYGHPGYGIIDVRQDGGALSMTYNGFTAPLEHWHYDVFRTPEDRTSELDGVRVQFQTDLDGEIVGLAVPMEPSVDSTVFTRLPPAAMSDPAFLARFAGTYEIAGRPWEFFVREDGTLFYTMFGTPYELVPVRGTTFRVKEYTGMSVEFLTDASGTVDRVAIHGGEGTILGKRVK